MPYDYIPVCNVCGSVDQYVAKKSKRDGNENYFIQTLCSVCGHPISIVEAQYRSEKQLSYSPVKEQTEEYFHELSSEELIREAYYLEFLYLEWSRLVETQGDIDDRLLLARKNCFKVLRQRLSHHE
ncbi:hypothetical protein [Paenibacillus sp. FSL R7-0128]|uniref:hypothetical protein n=1 Tax=Paenibacillus sp. FSL R7-0128 TaxID=2954529 RepID=UPI0030FBDAB8